MELFTSVLLLFGGLGAFLLGFDLLSENIQKLATGKLRQLFNKTSNSRLFGIGLGIITTAIMQSSSVTTVMAVGFVNAGIMSLFQAVCVIMGANIGTTITAQIAALKFLPISEIVIALTAVGAFMNLLSKNKKVKTVGLAIAGLGIVFMGLEFMSSAMEEFKNHPAISQMLTTITNPVLLLLIGVAVTALVQSSSAVTSIIIVMVQAGLVIGNGGNSVLYVILGSNIGTCVTALLSSIGANTNAKRACLFHFIFNVLGSVIFTLILVLWPSFNQVTFMTWFPDSPGTQIAMFHTFFNVICTLLYFPFVKHFVKLTEILIPDKKKKRATKEEDGFMDKRFLDIPSLAIGQLQKKTAYLSSVAMQSLEIAFNAFVAGDVFALDGVSEKNEEVALTAKKITDYLIEISASDISLDDEKLVNQIHGNLSDIVRISELSDNLIKYTNKKIERELVFSEKVIADLKNMMALIRQQHDLTANIIENRDYLLVKRSDEIENEIDGMRKSLTADHIKRMNSGECSAENNNVFINLVCNLERAADHLSYMAHSIEEL